VSDSCNLTTDSTDASSLSLPQIPTLASEHWGARAPRTLAMTPRHRELSPLDLVAQLTDAGIADARDFLVRRLPWDLTRPPC